MDYTTLIFELITLLVIIGGLVIAIIRLNKLNVQLKLIQKQHSDEFEWKKRESSLRYSGLFHPLIRESKQELQKEFELYNRSDSIPKDKIIDTIKKNVNIQIHLNNILTYYENMALACRKEIVDENIIYDIAGKTMVNNKKKLINYIEYHRKVSDNDRLWKEFEYMATKFEQRGQNPSEKSTSIG